MNRRQAGSTRLTCVCWAITSETRTEYGSRVDRKTSVLPRASYQARTAARASGESDDRIGPSVPSPDVRTLGPYGVGRIPLAGLAESSSDWCRVLGPANGLALSAGGGDRSRRGRRRRPVDRRP